MVPEDASGAVLPPLPLDAWEDTKETLHRYAQVVSFAADCSDCEPYDLDGPPAWSGLKWVLDLREVLTAEDHMAAARTHFLKSLDDVARMREQYPRLPWGDDV